MNDNLVVAQNTLDKSYPSYVILLALALIAAVVILTVIIINQNRKIKYLQKPRYGFLGKPIYALFLIVFSVGSFGVVFYSVNKPLNIQQTNAERKVELTIKSSPQSPGSSNYSISIIPVVDGQDWGGNNALKFDVYWTITNSNVVSSTELGLSLLNRGGIVRKLEKGQNKIKATVFFENKSYVKEVIVNNLY